MDNFPKTEAEAHGAMLHMAADICSEGDYETSLDVIDEVRAQLVDRLQEKKEAWPELIPRQDTSPCLSPFEQSFMRPDYDHEIDNYFKQ